MINFVFANISLNNCMCVHIHPFLVILSIFVFVFVKKWDPNKFVFVFAKKCQTKYLPIFICQICSTLIIWICIGALNFDSSHTAPKAFSPIYFCLKYYVTQEICFTMIIEFCWHKNANMFSICASNHSIQDHPCKSAIVFKEMTIGTMYPRGWQNGSMAAFDITIVY